jgi:hypothetical protein
MTYSTGAATFSEPAIHERLLLDPADVRVELRARYYF